MSSPWPTYGEETTRRVREVQDAIIELASEMGIPDSMPLSPDLSPWITVATLRIKTYVEHEGELQRLLVDLASARRQKGNDEFDNP
jgi:hypothetical protein